MKHNKIKTIWNRDEPGIVTILGDKDGEPLFCMKLEREGIVNLLEALVALAENNKVLLKELSQYNEHEYKIIPTLYENYDPLEITNLIEALTASVHIIDDVDLNDSETPDEYYIYSSDDGKVIAEAIKE